MIPTGTLNVTLDLTFAGTLQAGANNTVERAPGTTTSPYGTYTVDVTR